MEDTESLLTQQETHKLLSKLRGVSDEDASIVLSWAKDTKDNANLLKLTLNGKVNPIVQNGIVRFRLPTNKRA